jgi:endoglucanase
MNRRRFLQAAGAAPTLALAALGSGRALAGTPAAELSEVAGDVWRAWKSVHLRPEGRVVDGLQQEASHSEGQGYGALLATEFGDAETATRIAQYEMAFRMQIAAPAVMDISGEPEAVREA